MKTYTKAEIQAIAEQALNAACESIQDALSQTDGGIAGIYFTGENEDMLLSIMKSYIHTEIHFAKHPA
jgi:hypothetical protein